MDTRVEDALGVGWYELLKDEFTKPYMLELRKFIMEQKKSHVVFPENNDIFNAFKYTPYTKVRVVILGQDPYIKTAEAHGLAFSTKYGTSTPSLKQIEKAVRSQCYNHDPNYVWMNNLERWANQGVMLLNSILTVNAGNSNSHKGKGWEIFVSKVIQILDQEDIIFMFWGRQAQVFAPLIDKGTVLNCEHPQASNYTGGDWNNRDCFNKANELIKGYKIMW
jgi:uracil-DNA glycosylase